MIAFFLSNSLMILADSLHSVFDLIAGMIAIYSLKIAAKPSDKEHVYGHGKAENIGALFEAITLIIVCIIVIYESISRLIYQEKSLVEFSFIVLSIVAFTLIMDIWRATALKRASLKFGSQVLEGDSLHYYNDAYITASVIVVILLSIFFFGSNVIYLDAFAAMFISSYFAFSGIKLGKRAVDELLDRAPAGVLEEIEKIINENKCTPIRVRARKVGNKLFVDSIVCLSSDLSYAKAHAIAEQIESEIRERLNFKEIDITLHLEPLLGEEEEGIRKNIERISSEIGLPIHNLILEKNEGKFDVRIHAEFLPEVSIDEAHSKISVLENRIKQEISSVKEVITHLEPLREYKPNIAEIVRRTLYYHPDLSMKIVLKSVLVTVVTGKVYLDLICSFPAHLTIEEVHKITARFESLLREALGDDIIITIHQEPLGAENR